MNHSWTLGLTCFLVSCATIPSAAPVKPLPEVPPLTVISLPSANDPIVSFRWVFRAGSVDDPQGKEGLTALTAQIMAEGGTRDLSSSELMDALFPMAAEVHVSTDKEFTVFSGRVHRDRLEQFFPIFSDTLLAPRFAPEEFERIRSDAISYIQNTIRGEDDETLGKLALDQLLYPNHPYRHPPTGTVNGLQRINLEDVKRHWKSVFTQDRLIVGMAGAVNDSLEKTVRNRLALLPKQGAPRALIPAAPRMSQQGVILEKDSISTAISMGYAYPLRRGHPDYVAVAFALSYLGEHRQFHGVLFQELREKRGLNYGNYAYAEHFHQEGWSTQPQVNVGRTQQDMSIWIRPVSPENAIFATRGALYWLNELVRTGPTPDAFNTARGFLLGATHLWDQTPQRRLGYAIDEHLYGTPHFLESFRQELLTLTPERVRDVARKHLSVDKLNFVFVTQDGAALKERLKRHQPSPISYESPRGRDVLDLDEKIQVFPIPLKGDSLSVQPAGQFMER